VFFLGQKGAEKFEKLGEHDASSIVADEVVGMWINMLPLYFIHSNINFIYQVLIAFALFRFFDITKVFPIKYFDNKQGAFWVMFDDVVAGIMASFVFIVILLYC
jgi:phosphatidylglycerophosphatase A